MICWECQACDCIVEDMTNKFLNINNRTVDDTNTAFTLHFIKAKKNDKLIEKAIY